MPRKTIPIKPEMTMTAARKRSAEKITRSFCELFKEEYREEKINSDKYHGIEGIKYVMWERKLKGDNAHSITLTLYICPDKVRVSIYSTGKRTASLTKWFSEGLNEELIYDGPHSPDRDKQGYLFQRKWDGNWIDDQTRTEEVIKSLQKPVSVLVEHLKKKGLFDEDVLPDEELAKLAIPDSSAEKRRTSPDNMKHSSEKSMRDLQSTIKSLLESNLQVILTGAPGTGKTYAAKKVAQDISKDEWIVEKDAQGNETGKWEYGRIASVQFHPGYDYSDFVIGMKPVLVSGKTSVSYAWKDGLFKKFAAKAKGDLEHNYVFLIDEINRADLSRVFGELFSLLEEEYRYPNGKGSDFILLPNGERFSIPKNLYIIGTMNDIDRSVESMDFALRRRFAWYEVTADMSEGILDAVDENGIRKVSKPDSDLLKKAMEKLNAIIGGKEFKVTDVNGSPQNCKLRLGSEYQLGGAIFAKLEKYVKGNSTRSPQKADEVAFDKLWNNHIENILLEYLRGQSNRTELVKGLKQVFDDAVKDIDKHGESGRTGDSATVDKNPATDSKSQS